MSRVKDHLTYANVMATVAVFIALGAGAYAAGLPKNSVDSKQIKAGAVGEDELANSVITSPKVVNHSLRAEDFAPGELPAGSQGPAGAAGAAGAAGLPGGTGPTGPAGSMPSSEAYHEVGASGQPAFQNGWVNASVNLETAGFYKDPLGIVHLKGNIEDGGTTVIFRLPTGYRPPKRLSIGVPADFAHGEILIEGESEPTVAGEVKLNVGASASNVSLDGITFRAAG